MFTNNYKKLQKMIAYDNIEFTFIDCENNKRTAYPYYSPYFYSNIGHHMKRAFCKQIQLSVSGNPTKLSQTSGIYFGSGNTLPTPDDYKLESPITSGLEITNASNIVIDETVPEKYTLISDLRVKNTSEEVITIREIGVFCGINTNTGYFSYDAGGNTWYTTLMERTVLSNPVTINPGESRIISYKLTFNHAVN